MKMQELIPRGNELHRDDRIINRLPLTNAFYCNRKIHVDLYNGNLLGGSEVKTNGISSFAETIQRIARLRGDDWGAQIEGKMAYYMHDLRAYDIVYHHICSTNIRTQKQSPVKYRDHPDLQSNKRQKPGRLFNEESGIALARVCSFFGDSDDEQLTVKELCEMLRCFGAEYNVR
jgi:hypothetical protein